MKVLYLVTDDWYFLSHRAQLACAAREAGAEVVVVTAPGERVAEIEALGLRHRSLPAFHRSVVTQPWNLRVLTALERLYREERPDLVHHVSFLPIFFGSLAARRAGVPAVVNAVTGLGHAFASRSPGARILRWALEHGYRRALAGEHTLAIFQNQDDLRHFVERALVDEGRAVLVPGSGVDTTRFAARPEGGEPVLLHASRMLWSKGVGDTVAAARLLRARGVAHRLVLAGRLHPTNPRAIRATELEAWRREGLAEWLGQEEDLPALLAASAIVCLPSTYREGVPLVLLEAAAVGRAIVTTDVPGCRDAVEDGVNGLVVPPRAPARLADALERLLADPELRTRMGAAGRARVLARFSKEIVSAQTLACYARLVPDRWPPRRIPTGPRDYPPTSAPPKWLSA